MRNAVPVLEGLSFCGPDVGDDIVEVSVLEHVECLARIGLQRSAQRTLWIVDLNNRRPPVRDPREVMFVAHAYEILRKHVSGAAKEHGTDTDVPSKTQEIPAA